MGSAFTFEKKIKSRIENVLNALEMNMQTFSLKAGKSHAWCHSLLKRKGALKARDLELLLDVHGINPNYLVLGKEPMFLEEK